MTTTLYRKLRLKDEEDYIKRNICFQRNTDSMKRKKYIQILEWKYSIKISNEMKKCNFQSYRSIKNKLQKGKQEKRNQGKVTNNINKEIMQNNGRHKYKVASNWNQWEKTDHSNVVLPLGTNKRVKTDSALISGIVQSILTTYIHFRTWNIYLIRNSRV